MSAQSIAPRSRQQRPETDDVVLARAVEFSHWARNNVRIIIIGAVIAAVVIGGLLYYRTYQADRMERAATEFLQLQATVGSGNVALATRDLQGFIGRFEGTAYADEARLLLARVQLQEGNPAQAVATLEGLAADAGESEMGAQAALLLAAAQQAAGNTEAAVATYLRVADEAALLYHQQEALASAAILRMQANDFAGAAELYGRLVATAEEGTVERSIFEMRRAEAEAKAAAAGAR